MAYTNVWTTAAPLDTQAANQGAVDFRATKLDIMQRVSSFGAGVLANRPTPETTSGTADWTGVMYWATDTNQAFMWNGTTWVDISLDIPSSVVNSFFTSGILQIAHGGTGTATPNLTAGTGIVITGSWPDQTIASTGALSGVTAVDVAGASAAISTTPILTVPASPSTGTNYLLQWNAKATRVPTTGGPAWTVGGLTIGWTSPDGQVFSLSMPSVFGQSGTVISYSGFQLDVTRIIYGYSMLLNCAAGSTISYAFGYSNTGTPVMLYDLHIRLLQE